MARFSRLHQFARNCYVTCQIVFVFSLITYCCRNKTNYFDHYFDYIEANRKLVLKERPKERTHMCLYVPTKSSKLIFVTHYAVNLNPPLLLLYNKIQTTYSNTNEELGNLILHCSTYRVLRSERKREKQTWLKFVS